MSDAVSDDGSPEASPTTAERTDRPLPPGPGGYPVLGNAVSLVRDPRGFYETMASYGDVVSYSIPRLDFCTVLHPDLIEEVLLTDHDKYGKFGFEEIGGEFASEGLLFSEGDQWRRQRTAIQNAFTIDRIQGYGDAMGEYAADLVSEWEDGETVALNREFSRLTLRVLCRTLFDLELNDDADIVTEFARTTNERSEMDGVSTFLPMWLPTPANRRYKRVLREFRSFVEGLIDDRRGQADQYDDLLSLLLTAEDDEGETMTEAELRDQMVTFLFAGHETTSLALTYTVMEVATNPDIRRRLDTEYESVLGGATPNPLEVSKLSYTDQVIKEALRLYPPAFIIFRQANEDVELGVYRIPEGTNITLPQFHVHTDERWYDDPHTFDPERWSDDLEEDLHDYAYFPFGGGPRHCIGMRFAMLELKTVLPAVLQQTEFDLLTDPDLDLSMGATLQPSEPVEVRVSKRSE